jgi:hypothetical protein
VDGRTAWTLWRHGAERRLGGLPAWSLCAALLATTVFCRSLGALALLLLGCLSLACARALRRSWPLLLFALLPVLFVAARLCLDWQAPRLVDFVAGWAPARARSLDYRIDADNVWLHGFWQRPWLGWSAWGATAPAGGEAPSVARDSYWIITATCFGLSGLSAFFCAHLAPVVALLRRVSPSEWAQPRSAGTTALVVALCMFVADCMFNAMINPVYTVALGSITSLAAAVHRRAGSLELARRRHRGATWAW